uniref:Uncharacterized protein n=1 Tax=Pristionchus pacificus TaxID=54126 RepID=A0A2A6C8F1_PRIPA|eukprot:PDM74380.1 hypothetical protein PRIPAC_41736 [Pristionchus pacificus]
MAESALLYTTVCRRPAICNQNLRWHSDCILRSELRVIRDMRPSRDIGSPTLSILSRLVDGKGIRVACSQLWTKKREYTRKGAEY